jgi:[ribosomal protein S5]-alanine N-acetyltransferase
VTGAGEAPAPADALPVLPAGPFRLRAFEPRDVTTIVEASVDPVIPLISSVPPEASVADAAAFVDRQRRRLRDGYGYWIVPSARGRRAADFALASLVAWAFDQLAVSRLDLHVEPWNVGSIRTAERAGFVREGLLRSWQEVGDERRDAYAYSLLPADVR